MSEFRGRLRQLAHDPGYIAAVLFSLGFGMAACVAAFSFVNTLVFATMPGITDRSTLLRITWSNGRPVAPREFEGLEAAAAAAFTSVAAQGIRPVSTSLPSGPVVVPAAFVSSAFFETLGTHPVAGRLLTSADAASAAAPVLVIAETLWRDAFGGDLAVLGSQLLVAGRPFTIVGVTPDGFPGLLSADVGQESKDLAQLWIPLRKVSMWAGTGEPTVPWLRVGARLQDGVPLRTARALVDVIGKRLKSETPVARADISLRATRAGLDWRDAPLEGAFVVVLYLFVPLGVLAIGCINVVNLQLARAAERAGELSIRLAIGASRARIIRLLSIEIVLLAGLAGCVGWLGARAMLIAAQPFFPSPFAIDGRVLAFGLLIVTAVVAGAGVIPAWIAARDIVAPGLRDPQGVSRSHSRLRGALVVAQVAASVALLSVSGLALRTISARGQVHPLRATRTLVAELNLADIRQEAPRSGLFARAVLERLAVEPSISAVGCATFFGYGTSIRYWQATDSDESTRIAHGGLITAGWFKATDAVFLAGKPPGSFTDRPAEAVVSASLATRLMAAGRPALGTSLRVRNPLDGSIDSVEVVGVLADSLLAADGQPVPMIYLPISPDVAPASFVLLVQARSSDLVDDARRATRAAVSAVDPAVPFVLMPTFDERLRDLFKGFREMALFGFGLGALALLLAGTGLYALSAFVVRRRTREIGIRMAIGARPRDVVVLVLRRSAGLTVAGAVCGLAIAFFMASAMRAVLVGVSPLDPWTILPMTGMLFVVSATATAIPAWRAATVDPVTTLRQG
jgi:putative ABC transport system permease protein